MENQIKIVNCKTVSPEDLFINFPTIRKCLSDIKIKKKRFNTYLFLDLGSGLYKIGKAVDVCKRYNTLKSLCPMLKYIAYGKGNIENKLHKQYMDNRISGEWFSLSEKEVKEIINKLKA